MDNCFLLYYASQVNTSMTTGKVSLCVIIPYQVNPSVLGPIKSVGHFSIFISLFTIRMTISHTFQYKIALKIFKISGHFFQKN